MPELQEYRRKKQRRIRYIIFSCLCLIPFLTFLETRVFDIGTVDFPVSGNVLVFVLININILLLLLMVFLVLRNLVELIFERRRKLLGTRLRTKLVISFVSLSLIPTALLFFIALQFVSTSMDYWFNINVEESLLESLSIAKSVYDDAKEDVIHLGKTTSSQLESQRYRQMTDLYLDLFLDDVLESHQIAALEILTDQLEPVATVIRPELADMALPAIPLEQLRKIDEGDKDLVFIQSVERGEMVRGLTPVRIGSPDSDIKHELVTSIFIPREQLERMNRISMGLEGYRQLMLLKNPIKTSLLVMLVIVTLLIVFCAIWFGFYVAGSLTGPIDKLAAATRKVAEGQLDFVIEKDSGDEMGTLVDSFNLMTRDLASSKKQIEQAHRALQQTNIELDQRRRYTETILQNVTAGVISLDREGRIVTINRFAEELLQIDKQNIINRRYKSVLRWAHLSLLENFLDELERSGKQSIQRYVRITVGDETFSLRVNFVKLEAEDGGSLGVVLVFDNLTEIEKIQRMAAWREVARRIAHEVKNPLTPIQLSAQRLRKKYGDLLSDDAEIFDKCTHTIINQVDELKRLVSEFSSFARMPAVRKTINSLADMVNEVLVLYREAHRNIDFILQKHDEMPPFAFDREQMKRVLLNLVDNAVGVLEDGGEIKVELSHDPDRNMAVMAVEDNGVGISDADKPRLFEPYFSTKKTGTGLGLAIASTIVSDHGGYIRVKDVNPHGARFIVELPTNLT